MCTRKNMKVITIISLVFIQNLCFVSGSRKVENKRLLLNDADQLEKLNNRITEVERENRELRAQIANTKIPMAMFTIWGKKRCPDVNGTTTIYEGILGGKHWNERGSGVNVLCLPHDPDTAPSNFPISITSGQYANIWGSEYEFSYKGMGINDDATCAVCLVKGATVTMMYPAKNTCPAGWTMQYHGFLIGAWFGENPSEYICVNETPEYFEGTRSHNDNGRTLYPARAKCGSLPCPNYSELQYIVCAVCSY